MKKNSLEARRGRIFEVFSSRAIDISRKRSLVPIRKSEFGLWRVSNPVPTRRDLQFLEQFRRITELRSLQAARRARAKDGPSKIKALRGDVQVVRRARNAAD